MYTPTSYVEPKAAHTEPETEAEKRDCPSPDATGTGSRKVSFECADDNRNDTEQTSSSATSPSSLTIMAAAAAASAPSSTPAAWLSSSSASSSASSTHKTHIADAEITQTRPAKRFRMDQTRLWDKRFEELRIFKERKGHCLVPRTYHANPQLGTWVNTQRKQYRLLKLGKQSQMTQDRLIALESIGFVWSKCEKMDWQDRFEELKQYKERFGDCLVPQRYGGNPQLGTWVNNQRTQYKLMKEGGQSPMNESRVKLLEEVGFIWFAPSRPKSSSTSGRRNE